MKSFSGTGNDQIYLIKTDTNGFVMNAGTWEDVLGSIDYNTYGYQFVQASDGGYAITGVTLGSGNGDMLICKVDANGVWLWTQYFGGSLYDVGFSIAKTSDGGYVLVGAPQWSDSPTGTDYDHYVVKTDATGTYQWSLDAGARGANNNDYVFSVMQAADGSIVFAGYNTYQNGCQATLYKYGP